MIWVAGIILAYFAYQIGRCAAALETLADVAKRQNRIAEKEAERMKYWPQGNQE